MAALLFTISINSLAFEEDNLDINSKPEFPSELTHWFKEKVKQGKDLFNMRGQTQRDQKKKEDEQEEIKRREVEERKKGQALKEELRKRELDQARKKAVQAVSEESEEQQKTKKSKWATNKNLGIGAAVIIGILLWVGRPGGGSNS